jgi:hypothetical protein
MQGGEMRLPFYFDALFASELIGVENLSKMRAVFMYELGDLYVEAAILGNFQHSFFPPPLDRVETVSRFPDAKSCLSNILQPGLDADGLFYLHEEIERSQLVRKIENGIAHQYLVVEVDDVEAHNKIGAEQLVNQIVDPLLRIDPVFVVIGTVSNTERHSHVSFLVPTTYVIRRALRFQIKINNVHSEG